MMRCAAIMALAACAAGCGQVADYRSVEKAKVDRIVTTDASSVVGQVAESADVVAPVCGINRKRPLAEQPEYVPFVVCRRATWWTDNSAFYS
jgi:hypothetical protein